MLFCEQHIKGSRLCGKHAKSYMRIGKEIKGWNPLTPICLCEEHAADRISLTPIAARNLIYEVMKQTKLKLALLLLIIPTLVHAQDKYICSGSSTIITGPDSASAYHWFKDSVQVGTDKALTVTEAGSYQLGIDNILGCTSPLSDAVIVHILVPIVVTISSPLTSVCAVATNSVLLTANSVDGVAYQWTRNGVPISGATQQTYSVSDTVTSTYGVNVSYPQGCSAFASKLITVIPIPNKPLVQ